MKSHLWSFLARGREGVSGGGTPRNKRSQVARNKIGGTTNRKQRLFGGGWAWGGGVDLTLRPRIKREVKGPRA